MKCIARFSRFSWEDCSSQERSPIYGEDHARTLVLVRDMNTSNC